MTTQSVPSPDTGHEPGKNSIVKVVFASLIGTAVEWYDFFLYGSAAALVFGALFFPESDPVTRRPCSPSAPTPWASWPGRSAASSSATSATGSAARRCWSSR